MERRKILFAATALAGLAIAGAIIPGTAGRVRGLFAASGPKPEIFTGGEAGIAINGYDPVGYFVDARPVKGSSAFTRQWKGAVWHFANAENLAKFTAGPEKYSPRFGGYCAYAVSQGGTATTIPQAWSIIDGRLYLNYSKGVKATFDLDTAGYIAAAETNWPDVLN